MKPIIPPTARRELAKIRPMEGSQYFDVLDPIMAPIFTAKQVSLSCTKPCNTKNSNYFFSFRTRLIWPSDVQGGSQQLTLVESRGAVALGRTCNDGHIGRSGKNSREKQDTSQKGVNIRRSKTRSEATKASSSCQLNQDEAEQNRAPADLV